MTTEPEDKNKRRTEIGEENRAARLHAGTGEFKAEEKYKAAMPPGMKEELEARLKQQALADNDPVCPDCKSRMVLRIAQSGAAPGAKFWGCTNYPKCRKTVEFKP